MLTPGDDYPLHQLPEPVAFAGSDRNFYDRYFFNGYSPDGEIFFAGALGVYPNINVMDAAFCISMNGKQHNLRASKEMGMDRLDMKVGPISVEVIEPLKSLRLKVSDNDFGITANLVCSARHNPLLEPRFIRRNGPRVVMDYTRLTQNVSWSGAFALDGTSHNVEALQCWGTRDRSWGIRPIGAQDAQPHVPPQVPQFYWLWTPINFENGALFFHSNDDAKGEPWNRRAAMDLRGTLSEFDDVKSNAVYQQGSRRITALDVQLSERAHVTLTTGRHFYMSGLGYLHPTWGHGMYHGGLEVACDMLDLATLDDNGFENIHIQALATAEIRMGDQLTTGQGVVEQLLLGPHMPSGFADLYDFYKDPTA